MYEKLKNENQLMNQLIVLYKSLDKLMNLVAKKFQVMMAKFNHT